ncbi:MAG: bifunctional 4-hydroxy-3-methylbut-2-enyl diphosphate reductase/30S ribosomal protein S1 [Oscillospiraceae bacterium]|nr:bifunctional 4-hydroxy-3-methylbut-2-enyl diphosphate reductase/30S ribosomal protein S1 [Oscillospiraceae bacterium]MCL2277832.1 bifunctional 4-hydroxy-3-methylbut-2-enyl diphosphate reductase/30S ribosomal protein S1 [Oscillospiraceae bacterium]
MELIVAKSAGFCYGVKRAVAMCEAAADKFETCFTLGSIIHNEFVVSELAARGVRCVEHISDIPEKAVVIIRSHGASKSDYEQLSDKCADIIDATCPDVKKIHEIVSEQSKAGRFILIIGSSEHPEVKAIAGWCDEYAIFESSDELKSWLNIKKNAKKDLSIVFQTTASKNLYETCVKTIKKECTNHKLFDTICNATFKRQQEAEYISKTTDAIVVVGDNNSSNSQSLKHICSHYSKKVFFVSNADEIDLAEFCQYSVIGVTAGASTPAPIIKEVIRKMSKETNMDGTTEEQGESTLQEPEASPKQETAEQSNEPAEEKKDVFETETEIESGSNSGADEDDDSESFEELLEKSIKTLRTGEKVSGIVTSITSTEVSLDLGTKQSGYIPITEFIDDGNVSIDDVIKVGDTIESFVMRVNDVEGMVMLSKKRLDAIKNWDIVESARENKSIVEGVVTEENKGGIVVNVKGVRVFVPASQTGLPKSAQMSELMKKTVRLRITEVNQSRRRVVGSIRLVQGDERREKAEQVWNEIEVGKKYDGVVKSMTTYGVFVDIGGVDGMVHISELSWTRIKQPSEVMTVGDEVSVYVISFDKESKKISLGYKKGEDNPWTKFTETYKVGDVVNVKIVKMMPFGAFAEICSGVDGLIHISQITDRRIGLPSEVLSDGQMVDVKITEIDNDRKKVSLSIRALLESPAQSVGAESDVADDEEPDDNSPAIVYDTDNPPAMDELDDMETEEE